MTAIKGVYAGLKPIKTRKVWIVEIEVPEEEIKHVTDILGFPNQSESQWVGIALLDESVVKENLTTEKSVIRKIRTTQNNNELSINEKSEGDKLRVRAVMLAKDEEFQGWLGLHTEESTAGYVRRWCKIKSRSELTTNIAAQEKFKELIEKFKDWKFEHNYEDNLSRDYT